MCATIRMIQALVALAFLAVGARASQVSCCFSSSQAVFSIALNGIELVPNADNSTVEFAKPPPSSVLVFQGSGQTTDLFVHCVELGNGQVWTSSSQPSKWTSLFGTVIETVAHEQTLCGSKVSAVRLTSTVGSWQVQTNAVLANRPAVVKLVTARPTKRPTPDTLVPTKRPTKMPTTKRPTISPTKRPTKTPTTKRPTISPTKRPTKTPTTKRPTKTPTKRPTKTPTTRRPTKAPTTRPTKRPTPDTKTPTKRPTKVPVVLPTHKPATEPSKANSQTSPFNIEVRFLSTLTPEAQAVFNRAAARWSEVVVKSYSSSVMLGSSTYCGMYFGQGVAVKDLVIVVRTGRMDGVGGALGSGTICATDELGRPRLGSVAFDQSDMEVMMATDAFYHLVLHEMGHVLGLGSLWSSTAFGNTNGLVGDLLPESGGYAYLGRYGNLADTQVREESQGVAVVEDQGGIGTARVHWKNTVYQNELMSGYLSVDGSAQPMSRLTIEALRDLGYASADPSKADEFYIAAPPSEEGDERRRLRKTTDHAVPLIGCGHGQSQTPVHVVQSFVKPGREEEFETDKQAYLQRKAR
ncbi:hypothetical protein BASA81_000821 [Batrachochytrium salamandrivorans]|nr:hypothetical protein BASA81_000821 [Batrachochytrium salamandrivorans]